MSEIENSLHQGGCSCAEVRYEVTGNPLFVHCCHCSNCQQQSGSAFALNAMIEADRVNLLSGETETIEVPTPSGRGQKITRCPRCRIALWSNYGGAGEAIHFIRVGTLDDPNVFPPDIHIFTSTKQQWVALNDGKPVVEEYYKSGEYWPRPSISRMKEALNK
jgi:hypothetical protein